MKKGWFSMISCLFLMSCVNNDQGPVKINLDSVGKKFDSSAERIWDSTKLRSKKLKDKVLDKLNQKDSVSN